MKDRKELAAYCLAALKEAGADAGQATVSVSEKREFNVDGGEFSLFRTLFNNKISLVAYKDGKKGTTTLNRFAEEGIRAAAADCLAVAASAPADPAWQIADHVGEREFFTGVPDADVDGLFDRTKELMADVAARHPKIIMEQLIVSHDRVETVYADTNGNLYRERFGAYGVSLMFSAHEGERSSSFFSTGIVTDKLDRPFISLGDIEASLSAVEKQIDTVPVSGKREGTVLFTPGCLCSMWHHIIGNFASGSGLFDGTSIWRDKLGKQVADPSVTLSLAPHDPAIVAHEEFTDDGYISENFDLIRDGVLESFVAGNYVANKAGCPRSKNTATSSLVMPAGDKTLDEIISSIEYGLLVSRFSGGYPGANGELSGVAKNSFLIEHGKITGAVSETMISGNLADMLFHPAGISRERVEDGESVLPYAAFSGFTISGK